MENKTKGRPKSQTYRKRLRHNKYTFSLSTQSPFDNNKLVRIEQYKQLVKDSITITSTKYNDPDRIKKIVITINGTTFDIDIQHYTFINFDVDKFCFDMYNKHHLLLTPPFQNTENNDDLPIQHTDPIDLHRNRVCVGTRTGFVI